MPAWGVGNCNPSGTELLAAAGGFYFHKAEPFLNTSSSAIIAQTFSQ